MKKKGYNLIAALFFLCLSIPAARHIFAEETSSYNNMPEEKPTPTPPRYIAMIFSKMTGQPPDFETWAMDTEAYQKASTFDKMAVEEQEAEKLKDIFSLLVWQDPVTIETPVKLSAYIADSQGFLVENFKENTFFPVHYSNLDYAIIPERIMDREWLPVKSSATARAMEEAAAKSIERMLIMSLTLVPKYADNAGQAALGGKKYWLISTEIKRVMIYDPATSAVLWHSDESLGTDNLKLQELIDLRQ